MSFSMTGYGQSTLHVGGYKLVFEIKSVNHRYCEIVFRLPREFNGYEDALRRRVQQSIKRGRVDIVVSRESEESHAAGPSLNLAAARAYWAAAETLRKELGLTGELELRDLLALPGVMDSAESASSVTSEPTREEWQDALSEGLERGIESLTAMRSREGRRLAEDIEGRIARLEQLHAEMKDLSTAVVGEYRDRLRQRLHDLNDGVFSFDEHRFEMEVAIFADRCSIDEELTRLSSHIEQCRSLLKSGEPIGRKLDFLIQEMNRETNTIGSKSNSLDLVNRVLECKAEIEKIREQAANIE